MPKIGVTNWIRMNVNMRRKMYARVKREAKKRKMTLTKYVREALEHYMSIEVGEGGK